jgi:hypothetical protein
MDDKPNLLDSLLESATDYGKVSFELLKLKAIDKTTDVVSTAIPLAVFILLILSFLLFLNLGIAFWLGEIFGKVFYGFLVVSAFYLVIGIIIHFFLNKWFKRLVGNYLVRQMLK